MHWVIFIGVLVLIGAGIDAIDRTQHGWKIVILLIYTGVAVWLYRRFRRSTWLILYKQRHHLKQLDRATLVERNKHNKEWDGFALPSLEQFLDDTRLPHELPFIVHNAHAILGSLYKRAEFNPQQLRPAQALALYQQFVQATNEGLADYASHLPKPLKQTGPALFSYRYEPTSDELRPANQALARHFTNFSTILPKTEHKVNPRPTFTVWDEDKRDAERREFQRELKNYDKYLDELWEAHTPEQQIFSGSSLFPFAESFAPEPTEIPFNIPAATRFSGTWIVAPPNRGKTNLLHNLIAEDRKANATVILMDSKGDLINTYRGMPGVVLIDPATANINPLQLGSSTRSVEFLEYIFSALLDTAMTALQKTLFRSVLTVLIRVPNATLETFRQILTVGWKPLDIEQYIRQCDPATQDFFLTGKPAEFDNATYRETKQQILWRLRLILSNDYLRAIFTSPTTNIPFSQLLDSRKTIIIDNSTDDLGKEGAEFFGRFFVALVWMAAVSRSRMRPQDKVPVFFYVDEAHTVIKRDDNIATILDECRSQKIALILAHQRCAQIISPNVLDALGNCAIRMANSDDDAAQLAPRFRVDPQALRLPIGEFACFVRDKTPQAVTIAVPLFDMSQSQSARPNAFHGSPQHATDAFSETTTPAVDPTQVALDAIADALRELDEPFRPGPKAEQTLPTHTTRNPTPDLPNTLQPKYSEKNRQPSAPIPDDPKDFG